MDSARDLFEHELRDVYDVEVKLTRALKRMATKCSDPDLVKGFKTHQTETEKQAQRLEKVFGIIDRKPRREPCAGINGLIEEFSKFLEEKPEPEVLDVFANGAAQKVEKYEICAYESLIELAGLCGLDDAVPFLEENLAEEQQTSEKLKSMSASLGSKLGGIVGVPA
jgi:ferritin-like metal-binding protein YciE